MVISDCGAVDQTGNPNAHNYTNGDPNKTMHAAMVQGGVDVNCGDSQPVFYTKHLWQAMANGTIQESHVDRATRKLLRTIFKLGMMDPPEDQPMLSLNASHVDSKAARALALDIAEKSMVLLKNDPGTLPLKDPRKSRIAFIGPLANATQRMLGAPQYHGANKLVNLHSPLQVLLSSPAILIATHSNALQPGCASQRLECYWIRKGRQYMRFCAKRLSKHALCL